MVMNRKRQRLQERRAVGEPGSREDNAALDPCTDSTSTAVNIENWPIEARKDIPHSHFASSCSQPDFPRRGVFCDLCVGFVPLKNL